jgi:hypothetical protein
MAPRAGYRLQFLQMRLSQWTSRKTYYLLAAMTLALWWGGYSLLPNKTEAAFATEGSKRDQITAIIPTGISRGECRTITKNGRRIAHSKPADNFPRPSQSQLCVALKVFLLGFNRKPRPDDVPALMASAAWLYQVKDSGGLRLPPTNQWRKFDHPGAYLRHCAFLI